MDLREILQFVVFVVLGRNVSALTLNTDSIVHFSQENNIIILNCSYHLDGGEDVRDRDIRWQKKIGNEFKHIATFSPPGGQDPFFESGMGDFYKNRTELIAPNNNTSLSAVMIVRNSECTDKGMYQCKIEYYSESSQKETSSSFVEFIAKAKEPEQFLVLPNELEEGESITLICSADIGSPLGNIQMWKKHHNNNTYELIYTSNTTNNRTENCTDSINVTTTHTVTRKDNRALFRCSSQNNLTKDQVPSRESSTITVIYGPDNPSVTLTPKKSMYSIGDSLTIHCKTDSYPLPFFSWSFQPHNESKRRPIERFSNISKIELKSLKPEDSGHYTCIAINLARTNSTNKTSSISVYVENSEKMYTAGCDQCGYIETCQQSESSIVCSPNMWVPIAVVFILLSATFAFSSIVLLMQRKGTRENTASGNVFQMQRSDESNITPGDSHGGYIAPADLVFGCPPFGNTQDDKGGLYSRI